jgi:hypothetical protein
MGDEDMKIYIPSQESRKPNMKETDDVRIYGQSSLSAAEHSAHLP